MTSKKSGRSRRTTPTSGRTRSKRATSTTKASTAAASDAKESTAESEAKAPRESLSTASAMDNVGDAGAAKEALASSEGGDDSNESTLSTAAGDSLSDGAAGKESEAESMVRDASDAEVLPPGAHRLTADDILSEDTVSGGTGIDSLSNSGTSAPLIEVTAKEVIEPPEEETTQEIEASDSLSTSTTGDSDKTEATSKAPDPAAEEPSASGSGGGGGGSRQPPAAPPPSPPVNRRSGLLKGVALGGVLVAVGYILAVGTSDLWLGKVVTPDSWNEQNQKIESLTKAADAAQKAADASAEQVAALGKQVEELGKRTPTLPKEQSDAIASLTKTVGDLGGKVEALAKKADGGSTNAAVIKQLNDEIAAAKAAGATLQKQVAAALKSAADSGKQGMAAVQKDLSDLQVRASKALDDVSKRLATLENAKGPGPEVVKEIQGMRAAVSRMETRTNTLITRLTSDPKAMEDSVSGIKSQADKLAADLSALSDKTAGALSDLSDKASKEVADLSQRLSTDLANLQSQAKQTSDALVAKVEGEVAGLKAALSTSEAALKDLKTSLDGQIADLKTGLEDNGKALAAAADGAKQNKAALDGLGGKVADLEKSAPELQQGLTALQTESGETGKKLAALTDTMNSFADTLKQRIDSTIEAALAKDMRPRAAALAMASASLAEAVQRGGSFTGEFDAVEKLAGSAPSLQTDLASLKPLASAGVSSRGGLLSSFRAQIPKILAAADGETPKDGDLLDDAWGAVSSLVEVRPVGEISGDTAKAIVARAEARLQAGNLTEAVSEVASLQGAAATAAAPWLTEARARLLALQAADRLQQAALASLAAQQN